MTKKNTYFISVLNQRNNTQTVVFWGLSKFKADLLKSKLKNTGAKNIKIKIDNQNY